MTEIMLIALSIIVIAAVSKTVIRKKAGFFPAVVPVAVLFLAVAGCTVTGTESTPAETEAGKAITFSTIATREMTKEEQEVAALSGMTMTFLDYELSEDVKYISLYMEIWTPEGLEQSRRELYVEVGDGDGYTPASGSLGIAYIIDSDCVTWRIKNGSAGYEFETARPEPVDGGFSSTFRSIGTLEPYEMPTDQGTIVFFLRFDTSSPLASYSAEYLNEDRSHLTDENTEFILFRLVPSTAPPEEEVPASLAPLTEGHQTDDAGLEEAILGIFDSGGSMDMGLTVSGYGDYDTYTLTDRDYAERLCGMTERYVWTETDMPGTTPSDFWIVLTSADGSASMIFWQGGGAETVQYTSGGETTCWSASPPSEDGVGIAEVVRTLYDGLTMDRSNIVFPSDGSAGETAALFAEEVYGSHLLGIAPGGLSSITDYEVLNWAVDEVSEDGDAILGWFKFAILPEDYDFTPFWAGSAVAGEGAYEGWIVKSLESVLQKEDDGLWHCTGLGTGGYSLPDK